MLLFQVPLDMQCCSISLVPLFLFFCLCRAQGWVFADSYTSSSARNGKIGDILRMSRDHVCSTRPSVPNETGKNIGQMSTKTARDDSCTLVCFGTNLPLIMYICGVTAPIPLPLVCCMMVKLALHAANTALTCNPVICKQKGALYIHGVNTIYTALGVPVRADCELIWWELHTYK